MDAFKEVSAISEPSLSHVTNVGHENVAFCTKNDTAQEIIMHLLIVAFPLFLQTHYIRNIAVVIKGFMF